MSIHTLFKFVWYCLLFCALTEYVYSTQNNLNFNCGEESKKKTVYKNGGTCMKEREIKN